MAVTLAEAQKRRDNPLILAILMTFIEEWPLLRNSQIMAVDGNALRFNREGTLPTVNFRAINGTVAASNAAVTPVTVPLKILAGLLKIDTFLDATTPNLASQEMRAQIKALALDGNAAFFKGDSATNPNEPDGLQKITTGLGTVVANNGAGGALSLAKLQELVVKTKGSNKALYCNEAVYLHLSAAASDPAKSNIQRTQDEMGNTVMVFAGARVYMAGEDSQGAQVLPFDEGVATDETSVYCVAHGEGFRVLNNTAGTDQVDELGIRMRPKDNAEFSKAWEFEWFMAPCVMEKRGVYRLSGVKDLPAVKE